MSSPKPAGDELLWRVQCLGHRDPVTDALGLGWGESTREEAQHDEVTANKRIGTG